MKILFITSEFLDHSGKLYPGGLATYTYNITKILKKHGIEPTIFTLSSRTDTIEFDSIKCILYRNSTYRVKKILRFLFFGQFDRSFSRLIDALEIYRGTKGILKKYDLVHCSNWKYPGFFLKKKSNFILRISSYEKLWDNQPGIFTVDKWVDQKLEQLEISRYRNIIGPGKYILEMIQNELGKSTEIIPTPFINGNNFISSALKHHRKFLYVGTLSYSKGINLLLELVPVILKKYTDAEFCVVGKLTKADSENITMKFIDFNSKFHNRFKYVHHLDRKDLNRIYQASEIVIIPSVYDNFPNVALEAMANECMVIASNTASLDTLITSGENGFIVQDRDINSWLKLIDIALTMNSEEKMRFKHNMKLSLETFSPDNAGRKLIEYYNQVLKQSHV